MSKKILISFKLLNHLEQKKGIDQAHRVKTELKREMVYTRENVRYCHLTAGSINFKQEHVISIKSINN